MSTTPTNEVATHPEGIDKRILGWSFLGAGVLLLGLFAYFLVAVVVPMTRPTPYFQKLTEQYGQKLESGDIDRLAIDLAVILEYASADIRTAGLQIAFSLLAGFFFCGVGVLLFTAGITGALQLKATHAQSQFELATAAPGIVCILVGAVIIGIGISKDVRRPLDAQVSRPMGVSYKQNTEPPPLATQGEPVPADIRRPEVEEGTPERATGSPADP
jgi:hypothetical protein